MALVLQSLGLLVLMGVVASLARRSGRTGVLAIGGPVVVAVVAGAAAWNNATPTGRLLLDIRPPEQAGDSRPDIDAAGGAIFPAEEGFLAWIDARTPKQTTMHLVCRAPACAGGLDQWITYRLSPRRFVADPAAAEWIVFYGTDPRAEGIEGRDLRRAAAFAPGYVLYKRSP